MSRQYHIGTSGWHYEHWRHRFYPGDLAKAQWLEFYARHFTTVELNNSFYRLPRETAFAAWRSLSPANFTFAVKVSRFITHIKRLKEAREPVDTFLSRAGVLEEKLGPLLYQLPPNMHRDDERLRSFLSVLPRGRKHVFKFRHQSWLCEDVFETLHNYSAGLCVFDMPSLRCPLVATTDFAYARFHGSAGLYSSAYSDEELGDWARRLAGLPGVKEVYIYFNNDAEAFAVRNARTLRSYLKDAI